MKIDPKVAERVWKVVKPGHWGINGKISVNRGYGGNLKIYCNIGQNGQMIIVVASKHGGIVESKVCTSHETSRPANDADIKRLEIELNGAITRELEFRSKNDLPIWANKCAI